MRIRCPACVSGAFITSGPTLEAEQCVSDKRQNIKEEKKRVTKRYNKWGQGTDRQKEKYTVKLGRNAVYVILRTSVLQTSWLLFVLQICCGQKNCILSLPSCKALNRFLNILWPLFNNVTKSCTLRKLNEIVLRKHLIEFLIRQNTNTDNQCDNLCTTFCSCQDIVLLWGVLLKLFVVKNHFLKSSTPLRVAAGIFQEMNFKWMARKMK